MYQHQMDRRFNTCIIVYLFQILQGMLVYMIYTSIPCLNITEIKYHYRYRYVNTLSNLMRVIQVGQKCQVSLITALYYSSRHFPDIDILNGTLS